ncbi:hypothetical protein BDZ89DRAFT_1145606 [Hymenopellis radicata]|nr:hypothetical protein BDZ89DRAFT_1145606 [Hymenopellis radicata]
MSITFQPSTGSIHMELHNPSHVARSLVGALSAPNQSLDDMMSTFLRFLPELTTPFDVTDEYDPRPAFLAAAVMRHFYTPMSLRPRPNYHFILIEHMEVIVPVVIPLMLHTLQYSSFDPQRRSYHPEDAIVLSTLAALLQHDTGLAHFADTMPAMLTLQIKTIICMWIKVSGSTSTNVLDIDLVKIIQALTEYAPTRRPLELAVASIPRSLFRTGLNHLNAAVAREHARNWGDLRGPPQVQLRHYLFVNGLMTALCSLLAYAIIDQPRMVAPEEWPVEKYGAYQFILAISEELHLLFKDEVDSPNALLEALNGRLLDSIYCVLHYFGRSLLTLCGRMPFLLGYIWHWSMKSRRVAHRVLMQLNDFRSFMGSWNELPQMPSGNLLTVGWHVFVTHFDRSVQASPESGRLRTMCMNPTRDETMPELQGPCCLFGGVF